MSPPGRDQASFDEISRATCGAGEDAYRERIGDTAWPPTGGDAAMSQAFAPIKRSTACRTRCRRRDPGAHRRGRVTLGEQAAARARAGREHSASAAARGEAVRTSNARLSALQSRRHGGLLHRPGRSQLIGALPQRYQMGSVCRSDDTPKPGGASPERVRIACARATRGDHRSVTGHVDGSPSGVQGLGAFVLTPTMIDVHIRFHNLWRAPAQPRCDVMRLGARCGGMRDFAMPRAASATTSPSRARPPRSTRVGASISAEGATSMGG